MKTKKWFGSKPTTCNLCGESIADTFIDGSVKRVGSWAIMCPECHKKYGVGLGTGLGQLYHLKDGEWLKVEG